MDKELYKIDREFCNKEFEKDIEIEQVTRETCDQTHSFAKLPTGNNEILGEDSEAEDIDMQAKLLEFYSQHYSANLMCLCVLGKDNLDELYEMVVERLPFSQIENKKIKIPFEDERKSFSKVFRKEHLQVRCSF